MAAMDLDRRPVGASVVVREAPHSAGGGLYYLARDRAGRPAWVRDPQDAEHHPSLREASRAALLAPPVQGSMRPAFAVPLSVTGPQAPFAAPAPAGEVARLRPVPAIDAAEAAPVAAAKAAVDETAWCAGGLWMWSVWSFWMDAWRAALFRRPGPPARP